ncbi:MULTISPECIES: winged helix-turn-helix domain-containing protein [Halobacterium]|uniref:TrmB family transcription regulator n=4 Tax=Halobacterium salinarum TaxID=2242 RepID=Q9HQ01_HALSA|nr:MULTISPECIES: winged helix-turn-helix domain-containing protein [Halobacterium]AAG19716.1 hypothetical protein VNG_1394H [Halobacterium salinarum NRC-1]MBB6088719.1 putative transcriptional regulator [Halobacterium salinarum]MCF2165226.1 winged helix-turn-helix domain-containing protein [Halobacterium salinarum]MCF2167965.1 winged helix-turn-helix domain-containing protein [Halobacterium salinarum]MCF2208105.1 winged helix-turn-helix domain-containing protein [Halobacterium salinarum]
MPEDSRDTNTAAREHLEDGTDRAVAGFDDGVVDVLAWLLDTDTRARIFVYLRQHPYSTSDEVADGTGLYPSTVREAVAELAADSIVDRRKRHAEGAGNNPYEYTAIPPSDLVADTVGRVQRGLNSVFNLDARLGDSDDDTASHDTPVRIEVEDASPEADTAADDT